MKKLCLAAFILAATSAQAVEQTGWYSGVFLQRNTVEVDTSLPIDVSTKLNQVGGIVGYQWHPNFAVESRLSFGLSNANITIDDETLKLSQKTSYAMYFKAQYPVAEQFYLYGLAGFSRNAFELKQETADSSFSMQMNDIGFSYGVGMGYQLTDQFSMALEYLALPDVGVDASSTDRFKFKSHSFGLNARVTF